MENSWKMTNAKWLLTNLGAHPLHKSFHLDRGSNVNALADLFESIVSLDCELDCIIAYLNHLRSRGHRRTDWRCSQVLDVDDNTHSQPSVGQVFMYRCRRGVLQVIDHDRRAVDLRHVLVEM